VAVREPRELAEEGLAADFRSQVSSLTGVSSVPNPGTSWFFMAEL